MTSLERALRAIEQWPVPHAAAAVVDRTGSIVAAVGDIERPFRLASITKPLFAYGVFVAVEETTLSYDEPAGPPGATVRHLLAHASGLAFADERVIASPGQRRIYSNAGFEVLGRHLEDRAGLSASTYLAEAVFGPLGMRSTELGESPAASAISTVADLALWTAELWSPQLLARATLDHTTSVQYPELRGVLPGLGIHRPNPWGLGFELRGYKTPHWTGAMNNPATFGHFGGSGTFFWLDREAGIALIALTDRRFGPWAAELWPRLSDDVLAVTCSP